jgi:hypothetical protein
MTVIPATKKVEIGRIMIRGQSRQKVGETHISTSKSGVDAPVIPAVRKDLGRRFTF